MWRSWKQVWTPVAMNWERTCCEFMRRPRFAQPVDQLVELVGGHEAAHRAVVDQHHRRVGAGAQALALLQREQAVGRGLAHLDAQAHLQVLQRLEAVAQLARQVGADVQLVLATLCWLYML
jgi:hypothetical protein